MGANPLSRLIRQADAASETASVLLKRTIREIRHDLADLPPSLNLAGSAEDREKAYNLVRRRFARLSRMLDGILADANTAAAKAAAKAAGQMTGLEVKYSPSRAKAICELVTPAQGENLAAVFTDKMSVQLINSLREATVATLRDQAVIGGTLKDMKRDLADRWALAAKVDNPTFTDASGRRWDTQTYFQMNVRTNVMRVYNDCLVDDVAREVGTDVMRISTGGDPDCACAAWEGCIISVSGKTKGLPTYEDARRGGCFHPNCTHTLEYVDEVADADEIALQKDHPVQKGQEDDPDAQDDRKYEIDQDRYRRTEGLSAEDARVAVDRDNLTDAIRFGLVRDDAREIVDGMTPRQVTVLCRNGNPPTFEPAKKGQVETWNHGSKGGVIHTTRTTFGTDTAIDFYKSEEVRMFNSLTHKTFDKLASNNTHEILSQTNPDFLLDDEHQYNCQRCVVALEARYRGIDCEAKPVVDAKDPSTMLYSDGGWLSPFGKTPNDMTRVGGNSADAIRKNIVSAVSGFGNGSRAVVYVAWKKGGAHIFNAVCDMDGNVRFDDGQSGRGFPIGDFKLVKPGRVAVMRTDNLEFTHFASEAVAPHR